jgi:Cdc6-like AAA superfamily ATPase
MAATASSSSSSAPLSVFARAREVLRPGALPPTMPCRDDERREITDFLRQALELGGVGRGMFVSGVPGTGKTATVYEVVRRLRRERTEQKKESFRFVEINGMSLPDPSFAFSVLHEELSGRYTTPQKAADALDRHFSTYAELRRCCVLLLDEVDLLVTRKQNVLYKLLDWPTYPYSRLIVIAIANTMDLPEQLLPRLGSRLGLQRVSFQPYNTQHIQRIVSVRLGGIPAFDADAVEICARKVASVSGDLRRALEICRRASEIAEERCSAARASRAAALGASPGEAPSAAAPPPQHVAIQDVLDAVKDMSASSNERNIQQQPLHSRLALCVLASEGQRRDEGLLQYSTLVLRHKELCRRLGLARHLEKERRDQLEAAQQEAAESAGGSSSGGGAVRGGEGEAEDGEPGGVSSEEQLRRYIKDSAIEVQRLGAACDELPDDQLALVCHRLSACRLIVSGPPREGCLQLLQLNVPPDDVIHGLRDDPICTKALNMLRTHV